jgi:hypothetical protein
VWFAWGAENDEIQVPKKSAETGGHHIFRNMSTWKRNFPCNAKIVLTNMFKNNEITPDANHAFIKILMANSSRSV